MERVRMTPELALLGRLVGEWRVISTIPPGPWGEGGSSEGSASIRWKAGIWLNQEFDCDMPLMGPYAGFGMITWIPEESAYRLWWFSNVQTVVPTYSGNFAGEQLIFTGVNTLGGTLFHERQTYSFHRDGTMEFLIELSHDGTDYFDSLKVRYLK
jgi:hypothetical protein